jgi:hypothetical protein
MRAPLGPEQTARGEASAAQVNVALDRIRIQGDHSVGGVTAALALLGCTREHSLFVRDDGDRTSYGLHTGDACISGSVDANEVTTKVHGRYAEPGPGGSCDRPTVGH